MAHEVRGTSVQVFPDGVVMYCSCRGHEQVPDGVGEWDDAIALEEHNSQAINQAPTREFVKSVGVVH